MEPQLFHIFRNTPLGRETLFQSIDFSKKINASMTIYIPQFTKFLMYFDNEVVQVDLDESYLSSPHSAMKHVMDVVEPSGIRFRFLETKNFTASTLPDIPTNFDFMSCPRTISDLSFKIGLGYIGPRVRRIVNSAHFPVLLTSPMYKEFRSVVVFFGGSANAFHALKLGIRLSRVSGLPLHLFTQVEHDDGEAYRKMIRERNLESELSVYLEKWHIFDRGSLEENLYEVPHDALCIVGAYDHGLIRDIMMGSKMEKIQSVLQNPLLVVGPKYSTSL